MPSVDFEACLDVAVFCSKCGNELDSELRSNSRLKMEYIIEAEPCEACLKAGWDAGFEEGQKP